MFKLEYPVIDGSYTSLEKVHDIQLLVNETLILVRSIDGVLRESNVGVVWTPFVIWTALPDVPV